MLFSFRSLGSAFCHDVSNKLVWVVGFFSHTANQQHLTDSQSPTTPRGKPAALTSSPHQWHRQRVDNVSQVEGHNSWIHRCSLWKNVGMVGSRRCWCQGWWLVGVGWWLQFIKYLYRFWWIRKDFRSGLFFVCGSKKKRGQQSRLRWDLFFQRLDFQLCGFNKPPNDAFVEFFCGPGGLVVPNQPHLVVTLMLIHLGVGKWSSRTQAASSSSANRPVNDWILGMIP